MTLTVAMFGPAKDAMGAESVSISLPGGATIGELKKRLAEAHPNLGRVLAVSRLALNREFASDGAVLQANDEVAVIPPVSGGCGDDSIWVDLVRETLPVERVREFVFGDSRWGGIVTFEGVTRAEEDEEHGALQHLEYEAYAPMALDQLERMATEARRRWSLGRVAILHRLGRVRPSEASVVIAVAAAHRDESFAACRWLIETLKVDVPIWKKDVFADGFARWVEPKSTGAPA